MSNKGLMYGFGSLIAIAAAKRMLNKSNSKNIIQESDSCSSCTISQSSSVQDLMKTFSECGYYWPETEQIFDELMYREIQNDSSFGSFSKTAVSQDIARNKIMAAVQNNIIDSNQAQDLLLNIGELNNEYNGEQLYNEMIELISKLQPLQIGILVNELDGIDYSAIKTIANLSKSVNSRIFINRYFQRSAFVITEKMAKTPLFKSQKQWRKKWTCQHYATMSDLYESKLSELGLKQQSYSTMEQDFSTKQSTEESMKQQSTKQQKIASKDKKLEDIMFQTLEELFSFVEKKLNNIGLDLNRERLIYQKSSTGDYLYKKPRLDMFSSIEKLSEVAWFIEMANSCGVTSENDMFYTFPREAFQKVTKQKGLRSIFDEIKYKMHYPVAPNLKGNTGKAFPETVNNFGSLPSNVVEDSTLSKPYIFFYHNNEPAKICFYSYASGSMITERTPVFTKTSKMNTISFSIPAGSPRAGGSCTVAEAKPADESGKTFICRGCYALKNRYQMLDYVFSSAPRMNWLIDSVAEGSFAALMSLAIESYSRYAYENGREELEIGYLKGNDLMYRSGKESYNKMPSFDINVSLGKKKIKTNSQKFFTSGNKSQKEARENMTCGYFRVHDSGDFSISGKDSINKDYIKGWGKVAKTFPNVKFWGPTRLWTMVYKDPTKEYTSRTASEEVVNEMNRSRLNLIGRIKEFSEQFFADDNFSKYAEEKLQKEAAKITTQKTRKKRLSQIQGKVQSIRGQFRQALGQKVSSPLVESIGYSGYKHDLMSVLAKVCNENENFVIRPSGLTVVSPINNMFIGIPMLSNAPMYSSIAAGSGVNAVFVKNKKGNEFTPAALEYLDYKDAFGDSKFKTYIKNAITQYLVKYFATYYKKANMASLPTYMYTPIYRQDDLLSDKLVGSFSPVYQCPVNLKTNEKGKNIKSGDSCKTSRCRFCWLAKDEAVTYGAH